MRKILAILLCKFAKAIGQKIGRGSSFPGKIALKICPDVLSRIRYPECVIAVTGSNGKTSTVEMISKVIEATGKSVAYNSEGSNQIEGVTTLVLCNSTLFGRFQKDVLLMEVDERYAQYVFRYLVPTYYVLNNLYRDQMTRNGHPEYVFEEIRKSIQSNSRLILNADDPLIASLAKLCDNEVSYFGIEDNPYVSEKCESVYDDGYYCPLCKGKMVYEYRQFAHVGNYQCTSCGYKRVSPDYAITEINLEKGDVTIDYRYHLHLALNTFYNAYNILATFAVASLMGIEETTITGTLNDYLIENGRVREFSLGNKTGTLLISKHENSISYNRNLEYVSQQNGDVTLLLIIDDISRKYFTSDTSWLWDIDFEMLKARNVRQIVLSGKYIADVATRLKYAGIDMNKVILRKNIDTAVSYLRFKGTGKLFVMTCFSDVDKFMQEVKAE